MPSGSKMCVCAKASRPFAADARDHFPEQEEVDVAVDEPLARKRRPAPPRRRAGLPLRPALELQRGRDPRAILSVRQQVTNGDALFAIRRTPGCGPTRGPTSPMRPCLEQHHHRRRRHDDFGQRRDVEDGVSRSSPRRRDEGAATERLLETGCGLAAPTSTTAPGNRSSAIAPAMSGSRRDKRCTRDFRSRAADWAEPGPAPKLPPATQGPRRCREISSGSACAQVKVRHRTHVGGRSRLSMRARPSTARSKKVRPTGGETVDSVGLGVIERAAVREHEDERLPVDTRCSARLTAGGIP